jgi:hypothetical protein
MEFRLQYPNSFVYMLVEYADRITNDETDSYQECNPSIGGTCCTDDHSINTAGKQKILLRSAS